MLRLISAVTLAFISYVGLAALMVPGLDRIQDGLESGKRLALAQYAAEQSP